jgi:hypothetical protein
MNAIRTNESEDIRMFCVIIVTICSTQKKNWKI